MAKVYYQRDERLIKNSKILEEYPLLIDVFNNYPELEDKELEGLSQEVQLFFNNIYPKVLLQAIHEWEVDVDCSKPIEILDDNKKIRCQLCNHNIKNVCYIKNKFNGNSLKVGTECVKHFEFTQDIPLDKILQEQKFIKRLEKLNLNIPNIERIINQWHLIIEQQPIYIKKRIKDNYISIGNQIKDFYDEYINKKNISLRREIEIIGEIKLLLNLSNQEKQTIIDYANNNKDNELIPTKEMIRYLHKIGDIQGLEWIEEDGEIKSRTLFRIKDEEFAKKLIYKFNKVLEYKGIVISNIQNYNGKLGYDVSIKRNTNIKLFCNYSDFTMGYGGIITGEEVFLDINQSEIIKMGELHDMLSIDFALGIVEKLLERYSIKYEEFYHSFNEILWVKEKNRKEHFYILTKFNGLHDLLKEIVFGIKQYSSKDLYDIILKNSTTLSNSDAHELIRNRDKMMA